MKAIKTIFIFLLIITVFSSCSEEEIEALDEPFVHIMVNESTEIQVNSNRRDVVSYYIYFSSKKINENLEVTYSIVSGDGLQEGRDYQIITNENPLIFPTGIFQRPIQIRWLDNRVDPTKDNTLKIRIEQNNLGISNGLPGPGENQRELRITKINN